MAQFIYPKPRRGHFLIWLLISGWVCAAPLVYADTMESSQQNQANPIGMQQWTHEPVTADLNEMQRQGTTPARFIHPPKACDLGLIYHTSGIISCHTGIQLITRRPVQLEIRISDIQNDNGTLLPVSCHILDPKNGTQYEVTPAAPLILTVLPPGYLGKPLQIEVQTESDATQVISGAYNGRVQMRIIP